jgi:subtilisin-like proprotein convertase family protein
MANWDGLANSRFVLDVGAVADTGTRAFYSETGSNLLVSAYSNGGTLGITTTSFPSTQTDTFGGTSAAAPQVAGLAALMLQANPDLSYRDVKEILIATATQIDNANYPDPWDNWRTNAAGFHFNNQYGAGLINAADAVETAKTWIPLLPESRYGRTRSGLNLEVPDNSPTGLTIPVAVSAPSTARAGVVEVTVAMTHTRGFRREIQIALISPQGTISYLTEENNLSQASGAINWTFTTVQSWGERVNGTWNVFMIDDVALDTSTVQLVGVNVYTANKDMPPNVAITEPANREIRITGKYAGVVAATATDDLHVAWVEFFADGVSLGRDKSPPYQASLEGLAAGIHSLYAIATDARGQTKQSSTVNIDLRDPAYLRVNLSPASAMPLGGGWFLSSDKKYRKSGQLVVLPSGTTQRIQFSEALGYAAIPSMSVSLSPFEIETVNKSYQQPGALSVNIKPFLLSPMPKWRINGSAWYVSGQTASRLLPGAYRIDFGSVKGYKTPPSRVLVVPEGKTAKLNVTYVKTPSGGGGGGGTPPSAGTGAIQVDIHPALLNFQWRIKDRSATYDNHQKVSNLGVDSYAIEFLPRSGYKTPASKIVAIKKNQTVTVSATYDKN